MVSILKDIPIEDVRIVPCRIAVPNRGVVKSFLVAGEGRVILVDNALTLPAVAGQGGTLVDEEVELEDVTPTKGLWSC